MQVLNNFTVNEWRKNLHFLLYTLTLKCANEKLIQKQNFNLLDML